MCTGLLIAKLQMFEKEFASLYLPTDWTKANQLFAMEEDYVRASSWCNSFTGEEPGTLLCMLEWVGVGANRLLSCLMVSSFILLGDGSGNKRTSLTEVLSRLTHRFSDRYGFGVIAAGASDFCAEDTREIMHSVLGRHLRNKAPDSSTIVNALIFYGNVDQKVYRSLLRQAIRMPQHQANSEYMFNIGYSLYRDVLSGRVINGRSSCRRMVLLAYAWIKRAVDLEEDKETRLAWVASLARVCYEARRFVEARKYSHELLNIRSSSQDEAPSGSAVHTAETVLGLVALAERDVELAKKQLLKSLTFPRCPAMAAFGPSLRLAEELHLALETSFVIGFLRKCIELFPSHALKFGDLANALEAGATPEWLPYSFY
jgi:hypothetical protein